MFKKKKATEVPKLTSEIAATVLAPLNFAPTCKISEAIDTINDALKSGQLPYGDNSFLLALDSWQINAIFEAADFQRVTPPIINLVRKEDIKDMEVIKEENRVKKQKELDSLKVRHQESLKEIEKLSRELGE